ncbi:TPA: BlaI/MecI/CopY family transcriptional regulator [Clostridioides difficile]|nr:BlaI/MecI/CopY family transcriptional regulator [Clostridioides difficile]MDW0092618.1 BlaI/MecI/CopY family transcriptional regulator [Clostridioides difficile]HBF4443115.1 BlaI/MecI/CopY family transcriptional regulator [Clostridioides difficile]HBG1420648.1 BlaI/MecI/CopY family transcriptional regulator [Clostridioides difficile]HBG5350023.1 BlaI/MecI/CopY family transcriptional regulator [Clostridioides difficile]
MRQNILQKIPPAELKVMNFIWGENNEVTSKEVIKAMENEYGWKQTTTLTLISRLVKRKFLSAEKIDKYTHYKIIVGNKEYINFETKNFMSNMHNNSLESLLTSLCENESLDEEKFESLMEIANNLNK